jgi:hypothetical protein
MISRNSLPKYTTGSAISHKDLNKLRDEANRLGRIRGGSGINVINDATGVTIGLNGNFTNTLGFASLLGQINQNGNAQANPFKVQNPPDGNWIIDTAVSHQILLYAPPTLNAYEYYPSGTVVTFFYNANWKRNIIISSPYCSC